MFYRILSLFGFHAIAQVILLAMLPIVTHLYSPDQFVKFAIFSALSLMIGHVSSLRLNEAFRLESDKGALMGLCLCLLLVVGLFVVLISWTVAVAIIFIGLFHLIFSYAADQQKYILAGRLQLVRAVCLAAGQVGFSGYENGLSIGYVASFGVAAGVGWVTLRPCLKRPSVTMLRRHRRLAGFRTTGHVMFMLSQLLPLLIVDRFYEASASGGFALGDKIVGAGATILTTSLDNVGYREWGAHDLWKQRKLVWALFLGTSALAAVAGWYGGPFIASQLLPQAWHDSGATIGLMVSVVPAVALISFSVRMSNLVQGFVLGLIGMAVFAIGRCVPFLIGMDFTTSVWLFVGLNMLVAGGCFAAVLSKISVRRG